MNKRLKRYYAIHVFLFIRKRFIRKWGYRSQEFKKVEGHNAAALRKFLITRSKTFQISTIPTDHPPVCDRLSALKIKVAVKWLKSLTEITWRFLRFCTENQYALGIHVRGSGSTLLRATDRNS